ncbi:hypothetical protein KIPB_014731 [Kipferlia bialata]|uniref:Phosphotyrosine protein phosphatase I domain-containing protein n=1 Tax=Kipferlia bialata TaxID=797122 RepID=A0A9K3DC03_9EUKA|nr:hypothetical protein KIPB_014731 [Kipferlia bialata]|eukprot:g14731.t1
MAERGIDLTTHRSTHIAHTDIANTDLFLCMSRSHSAVLLQGGVPPSKVSVVAGGVPDPYGQSGAVYEACAQVLERAADTVVDGLINKTSAKTTIDC